MTETINDLLPGTLGEVVAALKNGDAATALTSFLKASVGAMKSLESSVLVPSGEDTLEFYASTNEQLVEQDKIVFSIEGSIAGVAFTTGQTMAYDSPKDGEHSTITEEITGVKTDKYLAVPIIGVDEMVGILTFFNRPDGEASFQKSDITLAEQLAECCEPLVRFANESRHRAEEVEQELARRFSAGPATVGATQWDDRDADAFATSIRAEIGMKLKVLGDADLELLREIVERLASSDQQGTLD